MQQAMRTWVQVYFVMAREVMAGCESTLSMDFPPNAAERLRCLADVPTDAPDEERLAAIRNFGLRGKSAAVFRDADAVEDAILAVCDAIDADDGSTAALARFQGANNKLLLRQATVSLRRASQINLALPTQRDGTAKGLQHPLVRELLHDMAAAMHAADRTERELCPETPVDSLPEACRGAPPTDERVLAWLDARLAGVSSVVDICSRELTNAARADDGTHEAWTRIITAIKRFSIASAEDQYQQALRMYG